jgi:hypothetical protein
MEPVYVFNHQAELARVQAYKFSSSIMRSLQINQAFLDVSYVLFLLRWCGERDVCVCVHACMLWTDISWSLLLFEDVYVAAAVAIIVAVLWTVNCVLCSV